MEPVQVYSIYYPDNITIILELDTPFLLLELGLFLMTIFPGYGSLPTFLSADTEFPHRNRLTISRRLIMRVTKFFLIN